MLKCCRRYICQNLGPLEKSYLPGIEMGDSHSKYSRGRQVLTIVKASLSTIDHPVHAPLVAQLTKPKTRVAATDIPRANSC